MQFPNSLIPYAVLVPLLAVVTVHTLSKKPGSPGHKVLGLTLASLLYTCLCVSLTLMATRPETIIVFNEAKFVGLSFTPILLLMFYLEFLRIKLTFFERSAMLAIPVLTVFFAVTNPYHHFFRISYDVTEHSGYMYFFAHNNLWMYVHHIYAYIITFVGLFLIVRHTLIRSSVYREQVTLMAVGIIAAFSGSISVVVFNITDYADISVISMALAGLTSYAGYMLYSPTNMLNRARELAIKNIDMPFVLFDDLRELVYYNTSAESLMELSPDMLGSLRFDDFVTKHLYLPAGEIDGSEVVLASETLEEVYFHVFVRDFTDMLGKPSGCVILLENVTQGKRLIKELNFTLHRDKLTGMPNYLAFEKEFEGIDGQGIVLLRFNINNLKLVNTVFGNAHGDEVISTVANYIMSACPDRRLCARVSGDEFAVLMTDCRESEALELGLAVNVRLKHVKHLRLPVSVSYGAAIRMWDSEPLERLMRRAGDEIENQKLSYAVKDHTPTVEALCAAVCDAEIEDAAHVERTRVLAARLGEAVGLDSQQLKTLDTLLLAKDAGLLSIPSGLFRKQDALTSEETEAIKLHCTKGYRIAMSSPALARAALGILHHHECWDGSGYPSGLSGDDIPLLSRIAAIADAFDTWSYEDAELKAGVRLSRSAGRQFDPGLVRLFLTNVADDSFSA